MKALTIFIISSLATLSVLAQTSTLTIEVNGNRNKEVLVDGTSYGIVNTMEATSTSKNTFSVTDLEPGQHSLTLIRTNRSNTISRETLFTINLRQGYNLLVTINGNGTIQQTETRIRSSAANQYRTPMTTGDFNTLLQSVKSEWRQSSRLAKLEDAFEDMTVYITTNQAMQLIQLINSQANRLSLAKMAYMHVIDPANYTRMNSLLNTTGRTELAAYMKSQNTGTVYNQNRTPMTDVAFNSLYSDIQELVGISAKVTALNSEFSNTSNYFTTSQARQLILLVNDENSRLHLAKTVYRGITDPANFSQLYDVLSSQANRNELASYVSTYHSGVSTSTGTYPAYKTPMTDASFNALYNDVQNTWGLGAKMSVLTDVFANTSNFFTVAQAKQLIQLLSSEANRLQLAKSAYDNITDYANFSLMYDMFSSQASRDELAAYVSASGGSGYIINKVPMTDANFNSMYRTVQNTWGLGAKMSSLTDIFNNSTNYFTTAQAEKLIRLVSSETNRLTLAKLCYDNITDPASFSNLYDVLSSQSSRDELAAYVNSQSNIR